MQNLFLFFAVLYTFLALYYYDREVIDCKKSTKAVRY